jgi:hypothetical protein
MDYAEFWILETAVEFRVPFRHIAGTERHLWNTWNKRPHGLDRAALLDLVERLFACDDIVGQRLDFSGLHENATCIPTREEIVAAFDTPLQPSGVFYGYALTVQGGRRWEEAVRPDWTRFHSIDWDEADWQQGWEMVSAISPEIAELAFRFRVANNEQRPIDGTITRVRLSPWKATYWKTFDVGYAVRYRHDEVAESGERSFAPAAAGDAPYWAAHKEDYDYFTHWYVRPVARSD